MSGIMRSRWGVRTTALVALAALLALTGCTSGKASQGNGTPSQSQAPAAKVRGVSKDTIKVGSHLPLSGALAAGGSQLKDGAQAYFNYINDQGGINGRKIEWIVENDEYNPQKAVAAVKKLVEQDGVFAVVSTLGTATGVAVVPYLVEQKVPYIAPLSGDERLLDSKEKTVFGVAPLGTSMGGSLGTYAATELKAKKVAIFYQNDKYGKDGKDGFEAAVKKAGIEVVAAESHEPTAADISAQFVKIKNANPDVVLLYTIPKYAAMFLKSASQQGWKPTFLAPNPMSDPVMKDLAGDAVNGLIVNYFTALGDMPDKAVQDRAAILKKYYPNTQPGYYSFQGMAGAEIFVEALKRTGPDITMDKFLAAMEGLSSFETGVTPPITYAATSHAGVKAFGFAQWKDGQCVSIKGW